MSIKLVGELYAIIGMIVAMWQFPNIETIRKENYPELPELANFFCAILIALIWPAIIIAVRFSKNV